MDFFYPYSLDATRRAENIRPALPHIHLPGQQINRFPMAGNRHHPRLSPGWMPVEAVFLPLDRHPNARTGSGLFPPRPNILNWSAHDGWIHSPVPGHPIPLDALQQTHYVDIVPLDDTKASPCNTLSLPSGATGTQGYRFPIHRGGSESVSCAQNGGYDGWVHPPHPRFAHLLLRPIQLPCSRCVTAYE